MPAFNVLFFLSLFYVKVSAHPYISIQHVHLLEGLHLRAQGITFIKPNICTDTEPTLTVMKGKTDLSSG